MGQRGPKPKSLALKMLAGNPGKRPLTGGNVAPRFIPGSPSIPSYLSKTARLIFKRVAKELDSAGVLCFVDRDILAAYATAVADLEALSARIDKDGLVIKVPALDRNGEPSGAMIIKAHPALKWRQDLLTKVKQLASEIGVTPAARSRVSASSESENKDKPINPILALRDRVRTARDTFPATPADPE